MTDRSAPRGAARAVALLCLATVATLAVVAVAQVPTPTRRPSTLDEQLWHFDASPLGPVSVGVLLPHGRAANARHPLLVAFHGWGESQRGVDAGAWGWAHDYELGASDAELRRHGLRVEAFLGFVDPARYQRLRRDLARRPYQGLVVVTPFTPDTLDPDAGTVSLAYADWVARVVVARARAELPVLTTREATGVDGVSLGGLTALEAGLRHPETFGVVGALQPAVNRRVERVLAQHQPRGLRQHIRLVGTRADRLTRHMLELHDAMTARHIEHEVRLVEGPHDYVFNRGAGGVEMLLFHDRALRGMPAE